MKLAIVGCAALAFSCGQPAGHDVVHAQTETKRSDVLLQESFSTSTLDSFRSNYIIVAPNVRGAIARWEDRAIVLTMPAGSNDELIARRSFDVSFARGLRVRLRVRVRTDCLAKSFARATIALRTANLEPSYHDNASTSPIRSTQSTDIHAVMDVPSDAISGQIDLILHGTGAAWFEEVEVGVVGRSPPPTSVELSAQQISSLVTLSRAAAMIRYLHPSDQSSDLDWNAFLPAAIAQILRGSSPADLLSNLRRIFKPVAPTATFSSTASPIEAALPPGGGGTHLVRWRRYGFGEDSPYASYREGRDADNTSATALTRLAVPDLKTCKSISLRMDGQRVPGTGKTSLVARLLLPARTDHEVVEPWPDSSSAAMLATNVPADTQAIEVGLRVEGSTGVRFDTLAASCNRGVPQIVDLGHAQWMFSDFSELYDWSVSRCGAKPCVTFQRKPFDTFSPDRDMLHGDIGNGITLHVPLAVWADSGGTLPRVSEAVRLESYAIDDAEMRIAAISAAWGGLSIFYPYFTDQHTDWLAALPPALAEAAAGRSAMDTRVALCHLDSRLHDNHGKVTHPGRPITGIVPVSFRKLGDKIVVVGGIPEYLQAIELGSELLAINGAPAQEAYAQTALQVSAATQGLRDYLTPARMTMGNPGELWKLRILHVDGRVNDHLLPLVDDRLYAHANREPRPANGTELSPGIYYLDLDALSSDAWAQLVSRLDRAQAIIVDFRGYVTGAAYDVIAHIADQELKSPIWQIPLIPRIDDIKYSISQWSVFPQTPRFKAKVVALVDGRAMSAVETVLQIFREYKLGVLVGETSAGANGNVGYIDLPGGFNLRFTGLRASSSDGSTVHGHGFAPDHVVHPTLEGVRAGRDEILEAGVAVARRLQTP
jgi:hypothetical protein